VSLHEALLDEHLRAENAHDLHAILATYGASPVIELNGKRIEGHAAVREFHRAFGFGGGDGASFSDVHVAERHRHRVGDAVIVEQTLRGTHSGTWQGLAPTGRAFEVAVCTVYVFDADGKLACERVYLDEGRIRRQLTSPASPPAVIETFFSVDVADMARATSFYASAFGATVSFASPRWSSLHVAGVRVGLALASPHAPQRTGLHFAVSDLAATRAAVERAGGRCGASMEVAPGVVIAEAKDTEGNTLTLAPR
jgi:predicted enzyme related to lactoylglutathione lyase